VNATDSNIISNNKNDIIPIMCSFFKEVLHIKMVYIADIWALLW
jgi:hypothetical protein